MDDSSQLYFDDFTLGERFRSPGRTLGDAHFLLFAGLTGDNHPIHYDEDYARRTQFGARVAHGLLVMAMSALGASAYAQRLEASMIAFVEQGCRFRKPVLLGHRPRRVRGGGARAQGRSRRASSAHHPAEPAK